MIKLNGLIEVAIAERLAEGRELTHDELCKEIPQYGRYQVGRTLGAMLIDGKIQSGGTKPQIRYALRIQRVPAPVREFIPLRKRDIFENWRRCDRNDPRHADQPPPL